MLNETPIAFDSEGATLRGYVVTAADAILPRPTVIMAHGTSATIKMVAIEYARAFAKAGLTVLIYDHRNFGASDGEPRDSGMAIKLVMTGNPNLKTLLPQHPRVAPPPGALNVAEVRATLDAMGIRIPITNPAPRQVFEFTK